MQKPAEEKRMDEKKRNGQAEAAFLSLLYPYKSAKLCVIALPFAFSSPIYHRKKGLK